MFTNLSEGAWTMSETGKPETTEAAKAYAERRTIIDGLVEQLRSALDEHATKMDEQPRNWGLAGDLGHVAGELQAIVAFMTGGSDR